MPNAKPLPADHVRSSRHPGRAQPARLPQTTADLVNRMLAARCGAGH